MSRPEAAVQVEQLWKRYGYRQALRGLQLEIPAECSFAIFGPNGAGKSTLLKILATRVQPTSGRARVFGLDLRRQPLEARRRIGTVFHESCLRGDLTLNENLRYYASLFEVKEGWSRVEGLVARLGLSSRRHEPVRGFSQGMMKRATLIRSLLHDPRLWLLDEPFAGLDPDGQALLEELIQEERRAGRTVVFVIHDVAVGLRLADDAALLENGDVAARGVENLKARFAGRSTGHPRGSGPGGTPEKFPPGGER
ncbi:MAG: ABC transporter ATP-binding protein [Planctomycetes bacterium]|nr:ABC transporter ATP-binding protein [Planctomycetota bacterium]